MVVDTKPQEKKLPVHKSIYLLPNLITSLSMFMGFLSMVWAVQSRFEEAGLAIVLSALLDGMDGKVARLTHTASEFGVQYDSLADLIAFGLAPAFLLWQWQLESLGRFGVVVAFLKNLLFAVLHGTSSAYVGELFNFLMGSVFAFSAGFVYQRNKSRRGALLGAVIGTLLMAVLSVPLNYFVVYPAYVVCYHLPLETIIGMYQAIRPSVDGLLECLLVFNMPFTFFKGLLDVALCFLIYKPLSPLLHK